MAVRVVENRSIVDATSEVYDANVATPGATDEVLNLTAGIENIMKLKLKYAGHVMRHDSQQKSLLEGMVEGKCSPGRQRLTWMDNMKE